MSSFRENKNIIYIQLTLAMVMVGANIAVGKAIVETLPVFLFSALRFLIALSALLLIQLYQGELRFNFSLKDYRNLFMQALIGMFLFSTFMLYGVRLTTATSAGIITSTVPACIGVLSVVLLGERLSVRGMLAIGLAVLGIAAINFQGQAGSQESGSLVGNMLILFAVVSEAFFTIFTKEISSRHAPLKIATGVNMFGFLLFAPLALWEANMFDFTAVSLSVWGLIVYYALTASVLSFILWCQGVAKVSISLAGLFTGFMPLSNALVASMKEQKGRPEK
ncbi:DMT family transporter [Nostoc sp. CHAB 5715]|uniref:DMT family transporter n=1 Tax=Nostoc sp. CHAB 5715 TaxID=2780400 RepID=UPI001E2E8791|nr:DMT family transporter [Nostoc sp. CHAB 5715]MCC5625202.1 DMT family transporter [Nostoc sp. CHAB 5715]